VITSSIVLESNIVILSKSAKKLDTSKYFQIKLVDSICILLYGVYKKFISYVKNYEISGISKNSINL